MTHKKQYQTAVSDSLYNVLDKQSHKLVKKVANNEQAQDEWVYQNYDINAKLDEKGVKLSGDIIKNLNLLDVGKIPDILDLERLKGLNIKGIYTYLGGNKTYNGEWKDGERHGKGILTWPNGDKYEGEWKNGKHEGKGICTPMQMAIRMRVSGRMINEMEKAFTPMQQWR